MQQSGNLKTKQQTSTRENNIIDDFEHSFLYSKTIIISSPLNDHDMMFVTLHIRSVT